MADVEFAVMESAGKVSTLLKLQKQPVTPSDLKLSTKYIGLTKDIIMDGEIIYSNLEDINLNKQWLLCHLRQNGINDAKEIFYAG